MDRSAGETNEARELLLRFRSWLDDPEASPGIIRDLLGLDNERLGALVRLSTGAEMLSSIRTLLDRSRESSAGHPREAIRLTRLATSLSSCYATADAHHDAAVEGDAWKAHADALLRAGDFREADRACQQASSFYSLVDPEECLYERTMLNVTEAKAAHFVSDTERALALAGAAASTLARAFPKKNKDYIRAQTTFATILVADFQRYDDGLKALEECAELARRENETESLASLVNNIGHVYARIGKLTEAKECFTAALQGFTSLGLTTEIPRVFVGLARILMQEGRPNEAISELFKARSAYLDLKMPVVAAEVNAHIIEALFAAGRMKDIPTLCALTLEAFTTANLPREAAKALAYMNAAAQRRTLTTDEVEGVRAFLERLQADPDERFDFI
jgi:tetratricopeptide (TPR) repeat protein